MRLNILVFFALLFCKSLLFSQIAVQNPSKSDFSGTLSFLASDWMQGRKATEKGGFMAADYIASLMKSYQLVPYNKTDSNYFQDFKISPYRNYLVFSISSFLIGLQFLVFALIADMIKSNRKLTEDQMYLIKKEKYGK